MLNQHLELPSLILQQILELQPGSLSLSSRKGNHFREKLSQAGYITPVTFPGLHAWLRLFKITAEGAARLKELGQPAPTFKAGGLEHQYWQKKLAEHYQSLGYKVEQEKRLNGQTVDLVATKGKECIAIEVETGKSDYMENVKKCLAKKELNMIILACVNKQLAERIREETRQLWKDRGLIVEEVRELVNLMSSYQ